MLVCADVWCVEGEFAGEFAEEDAEQAFEDFEQFPGFVEGKWTWTFPIYLYTAF